MFASLQNDISYQAYENVVFFSAVNRALHYCIEANRQIWTNKKKYVPWFNEPDCVIMPTLKYHNDARTKASCFVKCLFRMPTELSYCNCLVLEIKPCGLGSRIWDVEAFWYKGEIKIIYFVWLYGLPWPTDYGRPERKSPSLHDRKSTPTPKFLGTAEAYFVCHIGPNFQISLIYVFIKCP